MKNEQRILLIAMAFVLIVGAAAIMPADESDAAIQKTIKSGDTYDLSGTMSFADGDSITFESGSLAVFKDSLTLKSTTSEPIIILEPGSYIQVRTVSVQIEDGLEIRLNGSANYDLDTSDAFNFVLDIGRNNVLSIGDLSMTGGVGREVTISVDAVNVLDMALGHGLEGLFRVIGMAAEASFNFAEISYDDFSATALRAEFSKDPEAEDEYAADISVREMVFDETDYKITISNIVLNLPYKDGDTTANADYTITSGDGKISGSANCTGGVDIPTVLKVLGLMVTGLNADELEEVLKDDDTSTDLVITATTHVDSPYPVDEDTTITKLESDIEFKIVPSAIREHGWKDAATPFVGYSFESDIEVIVSGVTVNMKDTIFKASVSCAAVDNFLRGLLDRNASAGVPPVESEFDIGTFVMSYEDNSVTVRNIGADGRIQALPEGLQADYSVTSNAEVVLGGIPVTIENLSTRAVLFISWDDLNLDSVMSGEIDYIAPGSGIEFKSMTIPVDDVYDARLEITGFKAGYIDRGEDASVGISVDVLKYARDSAGAGRDVTVRMTSVSLDTGDEPLTLITAFLTSSEEDMSPLLATMVNEKAEISYVDAQIDLAGTDGRLQVNVVMPKIVFSYGDEESILGFTMNSFEAKTDMRLQTALTSSEMTLDITLDSATLLSGGEDLVKDVYWSAAKTEFKYGNADAGYGAKATVVEQALSVDGGAVSLGSPSITLAIDTRNASDRQADFDATVDAFEGLLDTLGIEDPDAVEYVATIVGVISGIDLGITLEMNGGEILNEEDGDGYMLTVGLESGSLSASVPSMEANMDFVLGGDGSDITLPYALDMEADDLLRGLRISSGSMQAEMSVSTAAEISLDVDNALMYFDGKLFLESDMLDVSFILSVLSDDGIEATDSLIAIDTEALVLEVLRGDVTFDNVTLQGMDFIIREDANFKLENQDDVLQDVVEETDEGVVFNLQLMYLMKVEDDKTIEIDSALVDMVIDRAADRIAFTLNDGTVLYGDLLGENALGDVYKVDEKRKTRLVAEPAVFTYEPPEYVVKLEADGGSVEWTESSARIGTPVALPVPVKDEFDFFGWYDNAEFAGEPATEACSDVRTELTYYAKWEPVKRFTVVLEADGGDVEWTEATEIVGTVVALPVPSKDRFDFAGWYDNAEFAGEPATEATSDVEETVTFYAKWEMAKSYTVTLEPYGGIVDWTETVAAVGEPVALPEPMKPGCDFLGWFDNPGFEGDAFAEALSTDGSSFSFYAKWEESEVKTFIVTLYPDGGIVDWTRETFAAGEPAALPIPEKDAFKFLGWFDNPELEGSACTEAESDDAVELSFYAKWEEISPTKRYTVTLETNGGEAAWTFKTVERSKSVELPIPVKEGSGFAGWYDNAGFAGEPVTEAFSAKVAKLTFYAKWDEMRYTVVLEADGGSVEWTEKTFPVTEAAALPVPVKDGSEFAGWYDNAVFDGEPATEARSDAEATLKYYAKWESTAPVDVEKIVDVDGGKLRVKVDYTAEGGQTVGDIHITTFDTEDVDKAVASAAKSIDGYAKACDKARATLVVNDTNGKSTVNLDNATLSKLVENKCLVDLIVPAGEVKFNADVFRTAASEGKDVKIGIADATVMTQAQATAVGGNQAEELFGTGSALDGYMSVSLKTDASRGAKLYRIAEDGTSTEVSADLDGSYMTFQTNQPGIYAIGDVDQPDDPVDPVDPDKPSKKSGGSGTVWIIAGIVVGVLVALFAVMLIRGKIKI